MWAALAAVFFRNSFRSRTGKNSEWNRRVFAANRASATGVQVFQGQLNTVDLPAVAFDVITVMGVLLYFRDPHADLKKLQQALRPGGLLAVELPLAEAQLWRNSPKLPNWVAGKSRSLLSSGHLFYYNVDSITRLFLDSGFVEGANTSARQICPVPAMKQRTAFRDLLSAAFFQSSRAIWAASANRVMLGPDFLVLAHKSAPPLGSGQARNVKRG